MMCLGVLRTDQMGFKRLTCKVCQKPVSTKGGNKSNLFHHLKQKHWSEYEESQKLQEEKAATSNIKLL